MSGSPERRHAGQSALDLIEEAVALLRRAPADAFFFYLLGAAPFWIGLLYFLSDMSRNAYAAHSLPAASMAVAVLYVWMKCWQTVFVARLRERVAHGPGEPWTGIRICRLIAAQAGWQPWGFIIRTLAAQVLVPYAWTVAFFQSLTVLGDGTRNDGISLAARAWEQARLWPGQTHRVLAVLWLFGGFVWLNVVVLLALGPLGLKMFLGIETAFSQRMESYFNTTFFAASFALTAVIIDPLWKAVFLLRCFRGAALRTGEDLAVELKQARLTRRAGAPVLVMLVALLACAGSLRAAEAPPVAAPPAGAAELEKRIGEVLTRREYAWRMPRAAAPELENTGWFGGWLRGIGRAVGSVIKAVWRSIIEARDWIQEKLFGRAPSVPGAGTWDWFGASKAALALLAAACAGVLVWGVWRLVRRPRKVVADAVPVIARPDLCAEHVAADQLPEDGWLALAREHAARGELQLALRAAWLAGLAHLGERQLLSIARYKSNRDYARELQRRARTRDEMLGAFAENLRLFERSWYGRHPVGAEDFTAFEVNLARIREC